MSESAFRLSAHTAYTSPAALASRGARYVRGPVAASSTRTGEDQLTPSSRDREAFTVGMPEMSYAIQIMWTMPSGATKI